MTASDVPAGRPVARPTVRGTVLLAAALGVAVLASTVPAWILATTTTAVAAGVPVVVTGAQAAPGVSAGGLVVLAAAGALALGGPAIRWVALVGLLLGGLLVVVSALGAPPGAQDLAQAQAREETGVGVLDGPAVVTALPYLAAGLGAAVLVLALLAALAAPRWAPPGTRHERGSAASDPTDWDALEPDDLER